MDPNELLKQVTDSGDFTTGNILIWIITGAVGTGYFIYGKKQSRFVPLLAGIALCVYPMFVSGFWLLLGIGAALIAAPFVWRE